MFHLLIFHPFTFFVKYVLTSIHIFVKDVPINSLDWLGFIIYSGYKSFTRHVCKYFHQLVDYLSITLIESFKRQMF